MQAKMLAGATGYDVVDHAGLSLPPFIKANVYEKLDKSKLPNWKNLDPAVLKILEGWDPGNNYGVPYMWGSVGMTFNVDMVKERLPNADLQSLDILFKPENAAKLADCGISVLDSPTDILFMVLKYLGKNPTRRPKPTTRRPPRPSSRSANTSRPSTTRTISTRFPTRNSASSTIGRATTPRPRRAPRKPASISISHITCRRRARLPGATAFA
jgi:spermidine/putrescine-binding protein